MADLSVSASPVAESNPTLDSAVDSMVSEFNAGIEAAHAEPAETPAEVVPPVPGTTAEPDPAKEADPNAVVEPAKPEVQDEVLDPEDDSDLDKALDPAQKVNPLDLASSRGQKIYRSYKNYKAVSEAIGEDLTPERATALRDAYVDSELMKYEFASGDPARAKNFVEFWNQTSPEGMQRAAGIIPDTLAEKNPQAYMSLAVPVLSRYNNALYERAQGESNPEAKAALLYAARMIDWDLNGKYRADADLVAKPIVQADPRAQAVDQRWNEIQRYEQNQQETSRNSWATALDEANSSMLDAQSDKVLAPLKAAYSSDRVYQAARRDFIEAVITQVAKDQGGEQLYQVQRARAMARMSREDLPTLTKQYEQRASRVIRALAPGFLKEAGVAAVKQSQARNEALTSAAAAGASPQSGGAPNPKTVLPVAGNFRSQGEKFDAEFENIFK